MKVINNYGELEPFKAVKIRDNITRETGLSVDEAEKIKNVIVNRLKKTYCEEEVNTTVIRGMVIDELIKRGYSREAQNYKIYGVSKAYINNLLENGCRDNANIMRTTELVNKYICDAVWKPYSLDNMPKHCAEAHKEGYLHIHDLEYFNLRSNCMNWDIRWFARNKLMVDGEGKMGSVANPSKTLEVLIQHLLEVMGAGTQVLSGGQAFSHFNVFLAPYCRGRTYKDVKQCIQHYIFSSNMQGFSRGGQSIFSSINLEFEIPDFLKDEPAVANGGVEVGVYGDYQQEADMVFRAVVEVLKEKDAIGRYHTFPNTIFVIRENTLDEYNEKVKIVHELLAENPTIYFMNCVDENSIVMGCLGSSEKIWTLIDNKLRCYTFEELSDLFECDYGVTDISDKNLRVLTIDDNKQVIWHKVTNFIKNKDRTLYKVRLSNGKSFVCDDLHEMIKPDLSKVNIMNAIENRVKIIDVCINSLSSADGGKLVETTIESITQIGKGDSYCIEVNDRMIFGDDFILSGQCRTRLSQNYTGDWEKDLLNVGNFHYTTLNLPLLALESNSEEEFYNKITKYMDISREILFERRKNVEHIFELGMSNFLLQKDQATGEILYDIDRCSFSIGMCGLNEALLELYDKGVDEIPNKGEAIIKHMSSWINEYKEKDGLRWSLFFSPAESTAHRFATINKQKYPHCHVQGEDGSYYLTNSSHINVSNNGVISEHIRNADLFHKYAGAGNILHLWLGESYPNPEALYSLNKKIAETNTKFWAFTNDYTYCKKCGFTIQQAYNECPICDSSDVVVMSRITGYYQPVNGYNDGKKKEFEDRFRHKLGGAN